MYALAEHHRFEKDPLMLPVEFCIRHYAAAVTYCATGFIERNCDSLPEDLMVALRGSSNDFVRRLGQTNVVNAATPANVRVGCLPFFPFVN